MMDGKTFLKSLITKTDVELDHKWGLDHGVWSVIKHHNTITNWHYGSSH